MRPDRRCLYPPCFQILKHARCPVRLRTRRDCENRGAALEPDLLAAAGFNFRRLLAWLRLLLLRILIAFSLTTQLKSV